MSLYGRNFDTHTGFHGPAEQDEPLDVFTEGDEDGYVWPSEPVLPLDEEGIVDDPLGIVGFFLDEDTHYEETRRGL